MSGVLVKKTAINTCIALASQAIAVIAGLFLPQALMLCYGSSTNGLITSLQQIVSYLTLIEGGLTGSLSFALYKPIADGDKKLVNTILSSARRQYNRIGLFYSIAICSLPRRSQRFFLFVWGNVDVCFITWHKWCNSNPVHREV